MPLFVTVMPLLSSISARRAGRIYWFYGQNGERLRERIVGLAESIKTQVVTSLPRVLQWSAAGLPLRRVRKPSHGWPRASDLEAPYWLSTGPVDRPFNFCGHMRRLAADVVRQCDELRH